MRHSRLARNPGPWACETGDMSTRNIRLAVVMDPIAGIKYAKDSTLAMLLAAQARGFELHYLEQQDLFAARRRRPGRMRAP